MKSGKCGANLFWTLENETLTISGKGPMRYFLVTVMGDDEYFDDWFDDWMRVHYKVGPWFDCESGSYPVIRKVIIEDGVTSIGEDAFNNWERFGLDDYLESVEIADSVTDIEACAFCDCGSLKEVRLPAALRSIGRFAFEKCYSLEKISMPDGVEVEETAFDSTPLLNTMKREDGFVLLGSLAYKYKGPRTAKIHIPYGVKSIGEALFRSSSPWGPDTKWLEEIEIAEGVEVIRAKAFEGCYHLRSVTLPDSLKVIGMKAFEDCRQLESVTLPDSLEVIGQSAFSSCHRLKSITIPEGVTTIEDYAFADCKELESVTLPDSLEAIGKGVFKGCSKL